MAFKSRFVNVWSKVEEHRKEREEGYKSKAAETRQHSARLADMQRHVDMSEEKRNELKRVLTSKSEGETRTVAEKGAIIYTRLLDVAEVLESDIKSLGIKCSLITSKQSETKREKTVLEFKKDSSNKVIIISEAGGESVSLQTTNELILYNVPRGPGRWAQITGRTARMFSKYDFFNVHFITVEDSIDEYSQILLSAKKELEEVLLSADTIPLKEESTFNQLVLRKIRRGLLWKHGKTRKNPKED